jgi:hypothetical protein
MINEQKTKTLFDLIDCLNDANEKSIEYYIEVGQILNEIKDKKLYMHYASHIKDWIGLLKELNVTYTDAKNHIEIYQLFSQSDDTLKESLYGLSLQRLKQLIQSQVVPEKLQEYIQKASSLPQKDWMDELRQLEGYKSYLECDHQETEQFQHCLGCGKWIKG